MSEEENGPSAEDGRLDAAIERVVKKTFGALLDSGKLTVAEGGPARKRGAAAETDGTDIEGQVRKAVAQAQAEDKRSAAEKARDEKIAQLEAKLGAQEQQPREHRPIVGLMGWIHKDDVK